MPVTAFAQPGTLIPYTIERYFDIAPRSIFLGCRTREIVMARQIALWLDHHEYFEKHNEKGWSVIGRAYGFSHGAIIHSIKTVNNDMLRRGYLKLINDIQIHIYGKVRYSKPEAPISPKILVH